MTRTCYSLKDLVLFKIGGGWGSDEPFDDAVQVSVIRGADFPSVRRGDTSSLPVRWEKETRAEKRFLTPGDIILEAAGGTSERPTGRSVYISDRLLDKIATPAIPASFCKLLRADSDKINPQYLFYNLQDFYNSGGMWEYQVRSTGIANFQLEWFLEGYEVCLPSIEEQRRIAGLLGALDDKIESCDRFTKATINLINSLITSKISTCDFKEVAVSDLADFVNGGAFTKGASGDGRVVIRIAELNSGISKSTVWNNLEVADKNLASPGDILMAWSGTLGVHVWHHAQALINQHIFKVIPSDGYPDWLVYSALQRVMPVFRGIAKDKTTTMGHIKRGDLNTTKIQIPEIPLIEELDQICSPLWETYLLKNREQLILAELRDTLLPELMSGRMRVDEAKGLVMEALDAGEQHEQAVS